MNALSDKRSGMGDMAGIVWQRRPTWRSGEGFSDCFCQYLQISILRKPTQRNDAQSKTIAAVVGFLMALIEVMPPTASIFGNKKLKKAVEYSSLGMRGIQFRCYESGCGYVGTTSLDGEDLISIEECSLCCEDERERSIVVKQSCLLGTIKWLWSLDSDLELL